jgi:hypothetical protein
MDIDIEQCRENDMIKDIISKSELPIKHIKLLLRLSDAIYINAINYNVKIENERAVILLISSKPENKTGFFNTKSLGIVLYKVRDIEIENEEIKTKCIIKNDMIQVIFDINKI